MRRRLVVIGLGLGLLLLNGCYGYYHSRGYYGRGYYGGYTYSAAPQYTYPQQQTVAVEGQPGQVAVQGQPQGVTVQAQASVAGEGIAGSDGTRGWRVAVQQPEAEFQRLAQLAARASCQVEASTQTELRAVCNGTVHVVVRFDQANVYKLCAPNTDPSVCAQVWSSFGG